MKFYRVIAQAISIAALAAPVTGLLEVHAAQSSGSPPTPAQPSCQSIVTSTPQQLQQLATQMGKERFLTLAVSCLNTALSAYTQVAGPLTSMGQQVAGFKWGKIYTDSAIAGASIKQLAENGVDMDQMSAEQMLGLAQAGCAGESISSQLMARASWIPSGPRVTALQQGADTVFQRLINNKVPNAAEYRAAFSQYKEGFCKAVNAFAQVYARYQSYQQCVQNGYVLKSIYKSQRHKFSSYHRTTAVGGALTYKCGMVPALVTGGTIQDQAVTWNSTFKWSDDDTKPLNIISTLRDAQDNTSACDKLKLCMPIMSGSVSASMCMGVLSATSSSATFLLGAKVRYRGDNESTCLPQFTVPSFGYLAELESMANSEKQQLMNNLKNQIAAALPIDQQTVALLNQLYLLTQ